MAALDLLMEPVAEWSEGVAPAQAATMPPPETPAETAVLARQDTWPPETGRFKVTGKGVFLVTPADDEKPDKPEKREFVC